MAPVQISPEQYLEELIRRQPELENHQDELRAELDNSLIGTSGQESV